MQKFATVHGTELSVEELKSVVTNTGLCVTVILPMRVTPVDHMKAGIRLKRALKDIHARLEQRGFRPSDRNELLQPIFDLAETLDAEVDRGGSLVIFRAPDAFRHFFVDETLAPVAAIDDQFHVRPILPIITRDPRFCILALSQNHIRLLRCTDRESEEVTLPASTPKSFEEFLATRSPHSPPDANAEGGTAEFTSTTDRDNRDSHLFNFYRAVNKGVVEVLNGDKLPLVLAGVEYQIPIYNKANTYSNVVDAVVKGAPESFKGGELHKRALEAMKGYWEKDVQQALDSYEKWGGSDRVSSSIKQIVAAAHDGRIAHLFVADSAEQPGSFDESTQKVTVHAEAGPETEDLINAACLHTLITSGDVFVLPRNRVPHGADIAAVLRW
jgi:hypothetical protein